MKKFLLFSIPFILMASFSACNKDKNAEPDLIPKPIELTARAHEVIHSSNHFGVELFARTATDETGNMMLSPLSASVALTMALNGSEGDTYEQMREMLGYPADMTLTEINLAYKGLVSQLLTVDPKVTITLANALFYRLGFPIKPPFLAAMSNDFNAHVEGLNFDLPSAINVINGWASDNTNGKIPQVIDQITDETVMFLMNALYFKGDWTYQFDVSQTQNRPFILDTGSQISVPTMAGNVMAMRHFGNGFRAIELPYGQTNFSMVVIVPNTTLTDFYPQFTPEVWQEITAGLDSQTQRVKTMVTLPKFEFDYEKFLNEQLQGMGMNDAFSPDLADFSGITDWDIYISFVKQNTFVKVDEVGTEAAAVTTIGFVGVSLPPSFDVNKPFIFAIRERTTNTLLFIGSVVNPL
ncbi:MAG: serpin family protein [Bacteroidales bacterium]|nr:serpin family protein [Bacteroidales bacterium]